MNNDILDVEDQKKLVNLYASYCINHEFTIGQKVYWKAGLTKPRMKGPYIVLQIGSRCENDPALDIQLGGLGPSGSDREFVVFYANSNYLQPYKED